MNEEEKQGYHSGSGALKKSRPAIVSVIDDEEGVRNAVGSLLRSIGYSVETFQSAEEFLDADANTRSSCIISDIRMPGMNGIDLYLHLKKQGNMAPFIFITALVDETTRKRIGHEVFILEKPFDADELANFIQNATC